jgi:hypothetical protein
MTDFAGKIDTSTEALNTAFDDGVMSKEEAENIMKQFRQVDDGIDIDNIDANENTLSVGDNEPETPAGETSPETDSAEKEYVDDRCNRTFIYKPGVDCSYYIFGRTCRPEDKPVDH